MLYVCVCVCVCVGRFFCNFTFGLNRSGPGLGSGSG